MRRLLAVCLLVLVLTGCGGETARETAQPGTEPLELRYAQGFTVNLDREGRAFVTIQGGDRFQLVPQGLEPLEGQGTALFLPLQNIYLADSAAADLFAALNSLDLLRLTSTKAADWSLPELRERMEAGELGYAGKYNAPDYELLLLEGVDLALENTMLTHCPEVREELEELGIPVLVERSSYEQHPLGRLEWIKLYGLLTGRLAQATAFFEEQAAVVEGLSSQDTGKTAAFFYVSANGSVVARQGGDYVSRMMELAGGRNVLAQRGETARSTVNMQAEAFFTQSREATILFYNATVDGGVDTLAELLDKGEWLAGCRAVETGQVWQAKADLFQQSSQAAQVIWELHRIFHGEPGELNFFHRLT